LDKLVLQDAGAAAQSEKQLNNVLVFGNNGHIVRARTANQQLMVTESDKNDILFATGPAGTGKTYTAVALAVRALKEKLVKKIILTRPAVEAGFGRMPLRSAPGFPLQVLVPLCSVTVGFPLQPLTRNGA
jgi:phosphate starvation-inducible protein PhoH